MILEYKLPEFKAVPEAFDETLVEDITRAYRSSEVSSRRFYLARRHAWLKPLLAPNNAGILTGTHAGVYAVNAGEEANPHSAFWHTDPSWGMSQVQLNILSTMAPTMFASGRVLCKPLFTTSLSEARLPRFSEQGTKHEHGVKFYEPLNHKFGKDWLEQVGDLADKVEVAGETVDDYIEVEDLVIVQALPGVLATGDINTTLHKASVAQETGDRVLVRSLTSVAAE